MDDITLDAAGSTPSKLCFEPNTRNYLFLQQISNGTGYIPHDIQLLDENGLPYDRAPESSQTESDAVSTIATGSVMEWSLR
jgi:hypothetical protein